MTVQATMTDARDKMAKAIAVLKDELGGIRTGERPGLLGRVMHGHTKRRRGCPARDGDGQP